MNPQNNLDYLAAKHAQAIVQALKSDPKKAENTLTKTLGVLQEDGVYACFLYLLAREKEASSHILPQMRALLTALGIQNESKNDLEYAQELTGTLPNLLLAREALERLLIYARYGAKAADKGKEAA